jgi:hypothetical protein
MITGSVTVPVLFLFCFALVIQDSFLLIFLEALLFHSNNGHQTCLILILGTFECIYAAWAKELCCSDKISQSADLQVSSIWDYPPAPM